MPRSSQTNRLHRRREGEPRQSARATTRRTARTGFGHGRWGRKQFFAIVATYWGQGKSAEWVADKLGCSLKMAEVIFSYCEWNDQAVALVEDERQELDDQLEQAVSDPDR